MVPEGKGGPRVAHGGDTRDGMRQMDGLTMGNLSCGYSCTTLNANDAQTEELSYEIGAVSADVAIGGVRVNIIPKEGGNTFSGSAFGNFSNSGLQGDNLSRELLDLGLRTPDVVDSIWDSSVELGGPLVRDRLWFHGAYRNWGLKLLPANTFYDRDPADYVFEPAESRPGVDEQYDQSASLRLTWQATDQNKLRSTTTARRGTARIRGSWQDLNGDFFPDENELGPYSNANFGWSVITNFFADDVTSGFGARRNNWEYSLGIEQEILPRTSLDVAYWRRVQGNFSVTDNVLVEPGDFDEYCVTAPTDPRLPGGGGNEICGLYDVNPDKFGQVRNEIIRADPNGYTMEQVFDGLDVTVNSRVSLPECPRGRSRGPGPYP